MVQLTRLREECIALSDVIYQRMWNNIPKFLQNDAHVNEISAKAKDGFQE
jgi:hypothetical protein